VTDAVVLAGIGAVVTGYGLLGVLLGLRTRSWPMVRGEIARHRLETHNGRGGATFSEVSAYRYRVGDRPYIGERERFGPTWRRFSTPEEAEADVDEEHPVGQHVDVYVNPADPTDSLLEVGVATWSIVALVAGLAMLGVGIHGLMH